MYLTVNTVSLNLFRNNGNSDVTLLVNMTLRDVIGIHSTVAELTHKKIIYIKQFRPT
jgi:hypothetical protein